MLILLCALLLTAVGLLCIVLLSCVYLCFLMCIFHYVCIAVLHTLVAGLLARSQYSEGPATGHLDTGFSWFPRVYKQMLRRFPRFQVATAWFSCSPPDLNFLDPYFMFMSSLFHIYVPLLPDDSPIRSQTYYYYYYYYYYYIVEVTSKCPTDDWLTTSTYFNHPRVAY